MNSNIESSAMANNNQHVEPTKNVETLDELIRELYKIFESDHIDVEYVSRLMLSYKSNPADWEKFAIFDEGKYTRNLVDSGNGKFNLIILCWGKGQGSGIHDHANAHCFMKILKGELEETRYEWPQKHIPVIKNNSCQIGGENGSVCEHEPENNGNVVVDCEDRHMVQSGRKIMETNGVYYINDSIGLHRVENPSKEDSAVSLHLYCPPFDACQVFKPETSKISISNMTYWSKGGKRINQDG